MNILLNFWILILALCPMQNPDTLDYWFDQEVKLDAIVSSDLDGFRQQIEKTKRRLQEGETNTHRTYNALINQREAHWQEKSAFYANKVRQLAQSIKSLDQALTVLQKIQERNAPPKPDPANVPEEVWKSVLAGTPDLPHGAPGYGPGFERACPAFEEQDLQNLMGGMDGLEGTQLPDSFGGSSGLKMPAAGVISAGTWAYPGGGLHLGMDLALSMYTPVYAPADGIILYAAAPVGDGGGYLGNWCGWPFGGGNTIAMIGQSNDRLYGITFCHLSSRIQVRSGQQVHQGDLIAYSGNTGNSTGPHTHIELFDLKVSLADAIRAFQQGADFSFGTGWDTPATCSWIACRVRPELYFGR